MFILYLGKINQGRNCNLKIRAQLNYNVIYDI